jgi:hypothetical protein
MNKLDYCRKCKKRGFNPQSGMVCGLTNAKPAFNATCDDFEADPSTKDVKPLSNSYSTKKTSSSATITISVIVGLVFIGFRVVRIFSRTNRQHKQEFNWSTENSYQDEPQISMEEFLESIEKNNTTTNSDSITY